MGNVYAGWGPAQSRLRNHKKNGSKPRCVWLLASVRFAKWLVQIRHTTSATDGLSVRRATLIALFAAFAPGLASGVSLLGILLFIVHGVSP